MLLAIAGYWSVVALLAGGATAVAVQFGLTWLKSRADSVVNDQGRFREELWKEIGALRGQLEQMGRELNETRTNYAELLVKHGSLTAEHERLQRDHRDLLEKYENLRAEVTAARKT